MSGLADRIYRMTTSPESGDLLVSALARRLEILISYARVLTTYKHSAARSTSECW